MFCNRIAFSVLLALAWLGLPLDRARAQHPPEPGASEAGDLGKEHKESGEHTEEGSHKVGGSPNPLAVDPDLAIWTAIVFLVLMAVLWKFAWGPISKALDQREERIAADIAAAQAANEDAKKMLAQYEQRLAAAQGEVRGIMEEARRDAEHTKQEILTQARNDARAERDRAVRDIELATDQALKELSERSTNLAIDLASKIVQAELKATDHARLIDEALATFPRGNPSQN